MSKTVKEISMTIAELYQIRRDCLINDDKDTVFFCYKAGKFVKTLSFYDSFACSRKEFESFDVIEYYNIESVITYTKANNSCVEEIGTEDEIKEEITEQKEAIYHNENSDWYLINDNYKDAETIKEEEIDLTQYKIVKIESSECDIDYGFDDSSGVAKCYTWEGQDGVWYLEEKGCFTRFNSCEELENFMNSEY